MQILVCGSQQRDVFQFIGGMDSLAARVSLFVIAFYINEFLALNSCGAYTNGVLR